ncbi:MAG: hypothetical protein N4A74_26505 [Carboxylicivirga sp.]|jgi:hypothetical protein|nr:hypothetical protein [Carboxylicivirga sp.]
MKDNWDNNWSDYMKTTLDNYQPPVPDKLWDRLETNLDTNPASKIGLTKLIEGITLGIGVIISTYFLFQNSDTTLDTVSDTKTNVQLQSTEIKPEEENTEHKEGTFNKMIPDQTLTSASNSLQHSSKAVINTSYEKYPKLSSSETDKGIQFSTTNKINNTENPSNILTSNYDNNFTERHDTFTNKLIRNNNEGSEEMLNFDRVNYLPLHSEKVQPHLAQINAEPSFIPHAVKHKRNVKKELLYSIGGGMQFFGSWNAYFDPSIEYRINRFGFYGGIFYNLNNVREITSGEGVNKSTVNILTKSTIRHRLSLITGAYYVLLFSKKHQLIVNGGVISNSITLNGDGGSSIPFLIRSGLEFRLPVFRKYQSGVYYNYLFSTSEASKSGHQFGFRLLFGKKK